MYCSPAVSEDGNVYFGSQDGTFIALTPDGTELWSFQTKGPGLVPSGSIFASPAIGADGTIYVSFDDPYLRAVNRNGRIKWVTKLGAIGGFTLAVGGDGLIYAAGDDGLLRVITPDGTETARFQSSGWLNFPAIASDGVLIMADSKDYSTPAGSHENNIVWAIAAQCGPDQPLDLFLKANSGPGRGR